MQYLTRPGFLPISVDYDIQVLLDHQEQTGAVEACWAHNPEVRGSKPRSANDFFLPAQTML